MFTPPSAGSAQTRIENPPKCEAIPGGTSRIARKKAVSETISVTITRQEKYRFLVDFAESIPILVAHEPPSRLRSAI